MTSPDQERWLRVKEKLRAEVGEDIFQSWFARMDLERIEVNTAHLSVPTRFLKSWIQSHYTDRVLACWQGENADIQKIEVSVRSAMIRTAPPKVKPPELTEPHRDPRIGRLDIGELRAAYAPVSTGHDALGGSPLDLRLTFESFVIGRSNTLAHAAAKQVALARRGEPVMFNPLYIHAGVGLGKTHLLQATTWAGNNGAERKVLYLTAEKFMYGFVSALRTQTALAFKEALRGIDVLVIDDLQFLQGKSTQAEFCHTLNALIDAGRQVVIAADRPPTDLESLDDRMRSRLAGGLVVEMGPLGEELAARNPQDPRHGGAAISSELRRSRPGAGLYRQVGHPQRPRSRRRDQPPARAQQAHRPAGDDGDGRARGARPDPPAGAQARQDRGHPAHRGAAVQRQPRRPAVVAPHRQCRPSAAGGDVSGQDADLALAAGNRPPVRRARPHHRAACGAQDRRAGRATTPCWPTRSRS